MERKRVYTFGNGKAEGKAELQKITENAVYLENLIKQTSSVSDTVLFESGTDAL